MNNAAPSPRTAVAAETLAAIHAPPKRSKSPLVPAPSSAPSPGLQPAGFSPPRQASPAISEPAVARTASYSPAGSRKSDTLNSDVGSNPGDDSPAVSPAGARLFADLVAGENGGSLFLEQASEQQSLTVAVAHGTSLSATMTASPPRNGGTSGSVISAEINLAPPTTSMATAEGLRSSGRSSPRDRRPATRLSLPSLATLARDLPHRGQTYDKN